MLHLLLFRGKQLYKDQTYLILHAEEEVVGYVRSSVEQGRVRALL